ncbi:MAG: hypothetical protein NVSMB47_04430 [Polyangiales bacterium]
MSDLGPDARALLDAARGGDEPSDADRRRVGAVIARRVGLGAAVLGTAATASSSAGGATIAAAGAATFGLGKVALVVVGIVSVVGAVGGGAYVVHRARTVRSAPTASTAASAPMLPAPNAPNAPLAPLAPPPPALATATALDPVVAPPEPAPTTVAPLANGANGAKASPKKSTLEDELTLMQQAQSALGAGQPGKALVLLDEHAARFPNGTLSEERAGARVLALCALHRGDARKAGESFLAAHPASPLAARVRVACDL